MRGIEILVGEVKLKIVVQLVAFQGEMHNIACETYTMKQYGETIWTY